MSNSLCRFYHTWKPLYLIKLCKLKSQERALNSASWDMGLTDWNNGIPNEHEVLLMVLPANKWKFKNLTKLIFQKKFKKNFSSQTKRSLTWSNQSDLFLKRNTKFSNQKTPKSRAMLPFQKGVGEVSHKQQNLPVIDDIRIPWRPWDERLHSMIARLKRGTFWQKHKQTLVSRG